MNIDTVYYVLCIVGFILMISAFFIITNENDDQ